MAVVECGLCGWSQEIDEDLPMEVIEPVAVKLYAEHQLENHPASARSDSVVREYVETVASMIASSNGVMTRKHDKEP